MKPDGAIRLPAEKIIDEALRCNAEETGTFGRIGWSAAKDIADALRQAGLLKDEQDGK